MKNHHKKQTSVLAVALVLAAILVGARLYLPIWIKDYVNEQIAALENYSGSVDNINVQLWRGAYQIYGLEIHKKDGGLDKPFVASKKIDLSVEWWALLHGAIVTEIDFYNADINFAATQTGQNERWAKFVDALSPFDINRLEVHSGRLSYTNYVAEPNIHLFIDEIEAKVTNLRQVTDKNSSLPSPIKITGTSVGGGAMDIEGKMNILKDIPDFDLALSLINADLTAFNEYMRNYAAIDFQSGRVGIFAELAAANGHLIGYVKPVASNIDMVSIKQEQNPFNLIWESLASVFIELFKNQSKDQFAMRIPIEGHIKDPEREFWWKGFFSIFSNAFGQAFSRNPDGTINFRDAIKNN